jgi:Trk K+ transport system NAD-binding subunit/Kef-type K+ transport system membrane component KefB
MVDYQGIAVFLGSFGLITLSSRRIGQVFAVLRLPMITGYVFTGILAGPFLLGLIPVESVPMVRLVDGLALGFIAFSAGGQLYLKELRTRMRSIRFVTAGLVISTFTLGGIAVFLLSGYIPFMRELPVAGRIAVSLLAGAILVARSPSSAIAVIHELRARGPFTQTALGVTVVMDVIVIVIFSVNSSIADGLLTGLGLGFEFIFLLLFEVLLSVGLGFVVWRILQLLLSRHVHPYIKIGGVLAAGYGVFALSDAIRDYSQARFPVEVLLEPLLICMIAGFLITNYGPYRDEFLALLQKVGTPVYAVFFTLTGATLSLGVLGDIWVIALAIFAVRLVAIFIGSSLGGTLAGDPAAHNRTSWMAYVTQAGVGLGLAKEAAGAFPEWGAAFAAMMISIIVLNQVIGPSLFKTAITLAGEAHPGAKKSDAGATHSALIFGADGQALALARQLRLHDWEVKVAHRHSGEVKLVEGSDIPVYPVPDYAPASLREIGAGGAGAIVTMLSDEDNYRICEAAFESFGDANLVVHLNDRANYARFSELGAFIVAPSTAIVSLLDHYVRSPSAVSLLLGMDTGMDIMDMEVRNPALRWVPLRELRMPRDILIVSLTRDGQVMKVSGHTQFQVGDLITVSGSLESLEEVALHVGG